MFKSPVIVRSVTPIIALPFKSRSVAILTLLSAAPKVTVLPVTPLISPSCSKTISTLLVPSPTITSDDALPIAMSPPALVINNLPLASVSILASILPSESIISSFLDPGVISKSSDI